MRRSISFLLFLSLLCALLSGCADSREPGASFPASQPTGTGEAPESSPAPESAAVPESTAAPETEPPLRPGILCDEPGAGESGIIVTLRTYPDGAGSQALWQWSCRFDAPTPVDYDPYKPPVRFEGDKSIWTTYNRDGDSDNCLMGRCISARAEWDFLNRVLAEAEYEADPSGSCYFGTPVFLLRQGTDCKERTTRIPPGQTGYIDDELCRWYVNPDGSVLRCDADGSLFRAVTPLEPETVARLYLLYETYYRIWPVQLPCLYDLNERGDLTLLVRIGDRELSVPRDRWDAFLSLVSVEEDKELPSDSPRYQITARLFDTEDYPARELLRFRFLAPEDDPEAAPWLWISLREDGRLITERSLGGGYLHGVAYWTVQSPVRCLSRAVFDTAAILAFLEEP